MMKQGAKSSESPAKWVRGGRARDLRSNGPSAHFYDTGHLLAQMTCPSPNPQKGLERRGLWPRLSSHFQTLQGVGGGSLREDCKRVCDPWPPPSR